MSIQYETIIYDDKQANPNCGRCFAYQKLAYDEEGAKLVGLDESGPIDSLDDLYDALVGSSISSLSEYDWDELPTFGEDIINPEPNILSWDDNRVLAWDSEGDVVLDGRRK